MASLDAQIVIDVAFLGSTFSITMTSPKNLRVKYLFGSFSDDVIREFIAISMKSINAFGLIVTDRQLSVSLTSHDISEEKVGIYKEYLIARLEPAQREGFTRPLAEYVERGKYADIVTSRRLSAHSAVDVKSKFIEPQKKAAKVVNSRYSREEVNKFAETLRNYMAEYGSHPDFSDLTPRNKKRVKNYIESVLHTSFTAIEITDIISAIARK